MDIKIIVATHKKYWMPSDDIYLPVHVGKKGKTDLGYQAEIFLPEFNELNFCFRNSKNEWDNNQNKNYSFPIEKIELSLIPKDSNTQLSSHKKLRKSYIWSKKIKLAVYKIIKFFPRVVSGNYKKRVSE